MFVLLFAYVFGGAIRVEGGTYKEYLLGGILIQTLAFAMMGPAMSIATDLQEGVIDRFRTLPTRRSAYLLGHYFAEMLGSILTIVILCGTGLLVGWRTHGSVLDVSQAILLLLVFATAMIWLGLWLGILVRSPDAVMGIGFVIVFPLTFVSNAFVPIESMPDVLQWIAAVNPISVFISAVRTLFGNPVTPVTKHVWPLDHPVPAAWLYSIILVGVGAFIAQRRYRARTTE
jgi:ABC-2 type transport system permease protein